MNDTSPSRPAEPSGRFLRMSDVVAETRLSERTINRLHRADQFPRKRRLSKRAIGWWESEIQAWKAARESIDLRGSK